MAGGVRASRLELTFGSNLCDLCKLQQQLGFLSRHDVARLSILQHRKCLLRLCACDDAPHGGFRSARHATLSNQGWLTATKPNIKEHRSVPDRCWNQQSNTRDGGSLIGHAQPAHRGSLLEHTVLQELIIITITSPQRSVRSDLCTNTYTEGEGYSYFYITHVVVRVLTEFRTVFRMDPFASFKPTHHQAALRGSRQSPLHASCDMYSQISNGMYMCAVVHIFAGS